jgi:multimeric flavodoxin WrbA
VAKEVLAIVGSYRKGGTIDRAIDQILDAAAENGASVSKIFLSDWNIEFCRNCRQCTQEPGEQRGACTLSDDMAALLDRIQAADALVLGSPVNFGTVTALMKRFIERTTCLAHWPWGAPRGPDLRNKRIRKRAVLVTSSAMPAIMARFCTSSLSLLKKTATVLGAKTVGTLLIGLAAVDRMQALSPGAIRKARRLGGKLVST